MTFIADVHLGKLARLMRMFGFDTLYNNSLSNKELVSIAVNESRVLLSGNNTFKKITALHSFIVASEDAETQLQQMFEHFSLKDQVHPFTKCLVCNGTLQPVSKDAISDQLPQNTRLYFNEFWQCGHCKKVYWKGSHYEHMNKLIERMR